MDGWKYVTESGRKESGFENLKTRFQDCNLSRKQESKTDGMIESKQSFNRERKLSVFVERLKGSKYSINSLVYWVTYVHNVVYSFYRSMIYCYINCKHSINSPFHSKNVILLL